MHTTQIQEEEFVEPALHTLPKFVLEQINDLDKELKDGNYLSEHFNFYNKCKANYSIKNI